MERRNLIHSCGTALLAAALTLSGMPETYGQTAPGGGGNTGGSATPTWSGSSPSTDTATPTDYLTQAIIKNLDAAKAECGRYDPVYRIDCMRQRLLDIARRIPQGPAYREARQIIARASDRLGSIQARHADTGKPRQRSRGNARLKEAKLYGAVKRQNLDKAMAEARKVIEEAETQLLRASENSEKRASHYRRIAAAVGSTKVLLRSA